MKTDWIDVYYRRRDDESAPVEEMLAAMARLAKCGKIYHFGVSNSHTWRIARMLELNWKMGVPAPFVGQPPYNPIARGIETEVLRCCAHFGVGAVAGSSRAAF